MITFTDALVLPVSADPAAPAWFHGWVHVDDAGVIAGLGPCLLYTSPSPRDQRGSRMPSSA